MAGFFPRAHFILEHYVRLAMLFGTKFLWISISGRIKVVHIGIKWCKISVTGVGLMEGSPLEVARAAIDVVYSPWRRVEVKDAVVVDIGAFIGDTPLLFSSRGAKKVLAFEPSPRYFKLAQRNLAGHSEFVITNVGIGGWARQTKLAGSLMSKYVSPEGRETANILSAKQTIGEIVQKEDHVDLLKVDCEGSEYEMFESLRPEDLNRVRAICVEIHGSPERSDHLVQVIRSLGFRLADRTSGLGIASFNCYFVRQG